MTDRWMLSSQISGVIWLTGLSSSGKSTLADALKAYLDSLKIRSCILDGDVLRSVIPKGCIKRQKQDRSITLQGYPPHTNRLSLPN